VTAGPEPARAQERFSVWVRAYARIAEIALLASVPQDKDMAPQKRDALHTQPTSK
jgi:hypothetical protein